MMHWNSWRRMGLIIAMALLVAGALGQEQQGSTDLLQLEREPGAWALPAKDFAATRFSSLDQITTENVQGLNLAWSFSTGVLRGHEGQPLVIGDTMYQECSLVDESSARRSTLGRHLVWPGHYGISRLRCSELLSLLPGEAGVTLTHKTDAVQGVDAEVEMAELSDKGETLACSQGEILT
jgi:hypothetical protein